MATLEPITGEEALNAINLRNHLALGYMEEGHTEEEAINIANLRMITFAYRVAMDKTISEMADDVEDFLKGASDDS